MTKRRTLAAAVAAALALTAPAAAAPPLLSQDDTPLRADSTYGSGNLGAWRTDPDGLPFFRYGIDQTTDPRGTNSENNRTSSQHQLGNDRIVAFGWNDGYTTLWSQERESQWANVWEPDRRHWAGGYGYLNVDGKVLSTLYLDRPEDSTYERDFGLGFYRRKLQAEGLTVTENTYAPFGDDPLLLHDVAIRNDGDRPRKVSWFEYWDVNPYNRAKAHNRQTGMPQYDAEGRTLTVAQTPEGADTKPMTLFASALQGPVDGFETSVDAFFGAGGRPAPTAVAADALTNSLAPPQVTPVATQLFAFRAPLTIQPGETRTLRYAFGLTHADRIPPLVAKHRASADPLGESRAKWSDWLPRAEWGSGNHHLSRELAWDAYLLRSATVFEEECGHHTITQGGYYQYSMGYNLGYRSWLHYLLPITYTEPELAREILRYAIKLQPDGVHEVPYGTGPLCSRMDLGTSNDLDFWLLLAAAEYGLGARDPGFFDEQMPFYGGGRSVSAWEHLKASYRHMESKVGPNGGYIMGATGDWSDFSTELGPMTESTLVALQLAYAYPRLADLAELRGDDAFAKELRRRGGELKTSLRDEWTGKGWFSRGYFGTHQVGKGVIYGEPQPWGLLAGIPTRKQSATLVANIRRFLTGIGAPDGPTRIGSAMAPARDDPEVTERAPVIDPTEGSVPDVIGAILGQVPNAPFAGAAAYPGGVWFDVNGWLTWALGELDGKVPGARDLAWDEYTRNTLSAHATAFPDHWDGTISIDDACNGWYSTEPARCGIGVPFFSGNITEQPTWMVMNALRLAGLTPTRDGYRIDPHVPQRTFNVRMSRAGIAGRPGRLSGYVVPVSGRTLAMEVEPPDGARNVVVFANGRRVAHSARNGVVRFRLPAKAGRPADWAVRTRR